MWPSKPGSAGSPMDERAYQVRCILRGLGRIDRAKRVPAGQCEICGRPTKGKRGGSLVTCSTTCSGFANERRLAKLKVA